MKVTKIIKDYVTKRVNEAYQPKIKAVEDEYLSKYRDPVDEIFERNLEECNKKIKEELKNGGFALTYYTGEPVGEKYVCRNYQGFFINGKRLAEASEKLKDERKEKIEEILVSLELGASKEELDAMLSNL